MQYDVQSFIRCFACLVAATVLTQVPGCSGAPRETVVCTTGMVAELVRGVARDRLQVVSLMGSGVDPHLYKPSPTDVSRLAKADVIFFSGLHLEGKMVELLDGMAQRGKPTRAVTEKLEHSNDRRLLEVEQGIYDPHVWFDVELWGECTEVVLEVLADFAPEHRDEFAANAKHFLTELAELAEYGRTECEKIPQERRVLVTAHDAFQYFSRAFGIEVRAIQGISTENEAGVRKINELVEFITTRGVKAVFVESSVSDDNIRSLVEGCASRGHEVRIGGELHSDALGPEGTQAGTFTGMVRHNIDTIVSALK